MSQPLTDERFADRANRSLARFARLSAQWLEARAAGSPAARSRSSSEASFLASPELLAPGLAERLETALASLSLRVDQLASATTALRGVVADRLSEYATHLSDVSTLTQEALNDATAAHERGLRSLAETTTDTRRLVRELIGNAQGPPDRPIESSPQSLVLDATQLVEEGAATLQAIRAEVAGALEDIRRSVRWEIGLVQDALSAWQTAGASSPEPRALSREDVDAIASAVALRLERRLSRSTGSRS